MLRRYGLGLILLASVTALPARGEGALEWKFKEGDTFYLQTVSTFKQSMKAMGKELKQDVGLSSVMGYEVEKVGADGTIVLKQTIESVQINTSGGAVAPDEKLQGASVTITLAPQKSTLKVEGKEQEIKKLEVVKLEGYDALVEKLSGYDPMKSTGDKTVYDLIKSILTPQSLQQSARQSLLAYLPHNKTMPKPGDGWIGLPTLVSLGPLGDMEITDNYKYEGQGKLNDKDYEKISFTIKAAYTLPKLDKPADKAPSFTATKGKVDVEDGKGTLYFDAVAGRLMQFESSLRTKGTLSLVINGENVDTDFTQDQTTQVKLLAEKPVKK
jgi:hypothetical protein